MTLSRFAALLENGFSTLFVELMFGYTVVRLARLIAFSAAEEEGSLPVKEAKLSSASSLAVSAVSVRWDLVPFMAVEIQIEVSRQRDSHVLILARSRLEARVLEEVTARQARFLGAFCGLKSFTMTLPRSPVSWYNH